MAFGQDFTISSGEKTLFYADEKEAIVGTGKLRVTGTHFTVSTDHPIGPNNLLFKKKTLKPHIGKGSNCHGAGSVFCAQSFTTHLNSQTVC